jgi:coproporphyrinogen III oxidase-like Fe-S oxidoreductase
VIKQVMCNGYLNFADIAEHLDSTPEEIAAVTKYNPEMLQPFIEDVLAEIVDGNIHVSADGMFVVRNIAMLFDPNLATTTYKFSKTV